MSKKPLSAGGMTGSELMNRINDGSLEKAPTAYVEKVRLEISDACEELIDQGARIRPLMVSGKQMGWIRGVFSTEHKLLQRWVPDQNEFMVQMFMLATSLTRDEIEQLTGPEVYSLARAIRLMREYDLSIFPFLNAFSTTLTSEHIWNSRRTQATAFENRVITMPDGKTIRLMAPSDHARLWATLCVYRESAKARLDGNLNALMIVRPWAGKSADGLANDLKAVSRALQPNALEPWTSIVRPESRPVEDGWAHQDGTLEGTLKDLESMRSNDRHEQFIALFDRLQKEAAEAEDRRISALIAESTRKALERYDDEDGDRFIVQSEEEVMEIHRRLSQGRNIATTTNSKDDPNNRIRRYS
jgi:hypothetical protein